MLKPKTPLMTVDEFFAEYGDREEKWELIDGEAWLVHREAVGMAGGSLGHNLVSSNLLFALRMRLSDPACTVLGSDMALKLNERNTRYPDIAVYCRRDLGDSMLEASALENPTLIAEVLSPSTESYDRGGKAAEYRSIASVRAIILVNWQQRRIFVHERRAHGWEERIVDDGPLVLADPALTLTADEIYAGL